MIKLAAVAMVPLFAGFLCAQDQQTTRTETHTSTTKTTYEGTLVDAACRSSHSEHHESSNSSSTSEDGVTTNKSESSHSETNSDADCPITATTTSFGLMTPEGRYVRFDQPSNTRIVETVKTNKTWTKDMGDRTPIRVRVVGTPNGDMVVMESIR